MWRKLFPFGWSNPTRLALVMFCANLYFYLPISTLYLQGKGLNYVQINSLWGIIVGTTFLAEVPTGILADRLGRARSVQIALAFQVVGEIIFFFATSYTLFAAAAVAGGIGFAFSSGSAEALIYDSLLLRGKEQEMSRAIGFINAAKRLANLLAFALSSLLVVRFSEIYFRLAIAITAGMVFVGWLVSMTLRDVEAEEKQARAGSLQLLMVGLATLRSNHRFRRLALLALATIPFADYLLNLYQPRFVALGVPLIWLGMGLSLASVIGIAGARYAYLVEGHLGTRYSLLLVTLLPGLLYLLFAVAYQPAAAVVVFCLLFGSMGLKDPIFADHLNRHIDSGHRATSLSLINMASGLYVALMGLLIGRIGDFSLTYAFVFMGALVLFGALLIRMD